MGPIEVAFLAIGLTVTLIGLARGYQRELGSTTIIMVAIFVLTFFQGQIEGVVTSIAESLFGVTDETGQGYWAGTTFTLIFIAIVFAGYSGRILDFKGKPAPPPGGTILSFLVGLLNGYLIAGTLWYYQDEFGYPIQRFFEINPDQMTEFAQQMVQYLPPALFENPVYWMLPVVLLLLLRVRG